MNELLVFGVSGNPGSGKSTLAEYMHKIYGFATYEGSDILRNMARWNDVTLNGIESYDNFHRKMQRQRGMSFLAELAINNAVSSRVAQIGLRARPDFEKIRQPGISGARGITLALIAPPEVCLPRMDQANPKTPQTMKEYLAHLALEASPDEFGSHAAYCIDNADYKIDASGTVLDTFGQFDDIMRRIAG